MPPRYTNNLHGGAGMEWRALEGYEATLKAFGAVRDIGASGQPRAGQAPVIAPTLERAANMIWERSQLYVPKDTHRLEDNSWVEVSGRGLGAEAKIVYATWYAVYVHEVMEYYHEPPTQAKYLERATLELRGTITSMMWRAMSIARTTF